MNSAPARRDASSIAVVTPLHRNAFALLGATVRDDRRRITQLAEDRSLERHECEGARAQLVNPRSRLSAELDWLPGVSPGRADQLLHALTSTSPRAWRDGDLPALARANLAASELCVAFHIGEDLHKLAARITELADFAERVSVDDVVRELNEDRMISGFPKIAAGEKVEAELSELKSRYVDLIRDGLNTLPTAALISIMRRLAETAEASARDFPVLVENLIVRYENESLEFLTKEGENVTKLIDAIAELAPSGAAAMAGLLDKLFEVTRNWDKVAQPIQLSAKSRGVSHALSNELGFALRNLALKLHNEHGLTDAAERVTALLCEVFAELPELAERGAEDANALQNMKIENEQWVNDITYSFDTGLLLKKSFSISPQSISWNGRTYSLAAITRIRWGGMRHSVNGIPTGATYTIAFGDNASETVMELSNEKQFGECIDRLWRTAGVRLFIELLAALKAGRTVTFGASEVSDTDVMIPRNKFLGKAEKVRCGWGDVRVWTADGMFYVGSATDKKVYAALSYIVDVNTHVLENAIRMAFKHPGMRRLSDVLNQN